MCLRPLYASDVEMFSSKYLTSYLHLLPLIWLTNRREYAMHTLVAGYFRGLPPNGIQQALVFKLIDLDVQWPTALDHVTVVSESPSREIATRACA